MKRAFRLVAAIVVATGCSGGHESVLSVSQSAPVSSNSPADSQLRDALDKVVQQIEKHGDNLVVGKASSAPTSLDAARSQIVVVAKVPITASKAHNDWYIFGTAASDKDALKFHAGFAVRHGDTKIFRFGFW